MDGRYTVRITNPNATPWTRREEVCQRLTNCKNFLTFAWLALWTDSALFAAVIFNTVRTEGDGLIGRMTMKSGNDIQVISERDLPKPPPTNT